MDLVAYCRKWKCFSVIPKNLHSLGSFFSFTLLLSSVFSWVLLWQACATALPEPRTLFHAIRP